MARQIIINTCPYNMDNEHKCNDFIYDRNENTCKYYDNIDNLIEICNHPNPSELLGYNLTNDIVQDFINEK